MTAGPWAGRPSGVGRGAHGLGQLQRHDLAQARRWGADAKDIQAIQQAVIDHCAGMHDRIEQRAKELEQRGFALNFRSSHLLSRNWIQLSLLGDPPALGQDRLAHRLGGALVTSAVAAAWLAPVSTSQSAATTPPPMPRWLR